MHLLVRLSRLLPRKGTETFKKFQNFIPINPNLFHAYYLARGRKQRAEITAVQINAAVIFHAYYPARGRKPTKKSLILSGMRLPRSFTPITPQGDGNAMSDLGSLSGIWISFHAYYPARGRKRGSRENTINGTNSFTPITPQGDGNNYHNQYFFLRFAFTPITPQGDGNF